MNYNFPYKYYYFGSDDSIDEDVLIEINKKDLPSIQEDRKNLLFNIKKEYDLSWNMNFIVVENDIVIDTIYPKSWIDSVNNSLFSTYNLHKDKQKYDLCIDRLIPRNKLLAIYKTVRTILSMLTRTQYRNDIKPIIKGIHDFKYKIDILSKIDFSILETFNQSNTLDIDIWKIIGFYLVQNYALIKDNIEIYTKKDAIKYDKKFESFIYRKNINYNDKIFLNNYIKNYIILITSLGEYKSNINWLYLNEEKICMINEYY